MKLRTFNSSVKPRRRRTLLAAKNHSRFRGIKFEQLEHRHLLATLTGGSDPDNQTGDGDNTSGQGCDTFGSGLQFPAQAAFTAYLPVGISRECFLPSGSGQSSESSESAPGALDPNAEAGGQAGLDANGLADLAPGGLNPAGLIIVGEVEPNNAILTATPIPLGFDPGEDTQVIVTGTLPLNDTDFFSFEAKKGDIVGATVTGASDISLQEFSGFERIGSAQDVETLAPGVHPASSPLPRGGDATLSYVIDTDGTYVIQVATPGSPSTSYSMEVGIFRPVLENNAAGTHQILFVDFDGAAIDTSIFGGIGIANLSPLGAFLAGWGLTPADEDAVIDAILAQVEENLSTDTREKGNNGDYLASGIPGEFDIEILNSRDHADPFGLPNVSRVIVGGTIIELGIPTIGIAEYVDVGNFDTTASGVVLLDLLSAPGANPNSLNQYGIAPPATIIDLVGAGVGIIAAHEAGHFFGSWHTDQFNLQPNVMDQGGNLDNTIGVGPDRIWGTTDDVDVDFGRDVYVPNEGFHGTEDTLNVNAFGLSTGAIPTVISGVKFHDLDEDGVRDSNEPGLGGWVIFSDFNNNGLVDVREPVAITAANGSYSLFVPPGQHRVREVQQTGWRQTFPGGDGTHVVNIALGQTVTGINFGNKSVAGMVSGTKWHDLDGDGVRDAGEPGVAGFYIYLDLDGDDRIDIGEPAGVTDNKGNYRIIVDDAGTYTVREVAQPGWTQVFPAAVNNGEHIITVIAGETVSNVNFGNQANNDFGDAPAPYPTLLANNGAWHGILPGFNLGPSVDAEGDGQPNSAATGDDNVLLKDEDGVRFLTPLFAGFTNRTVEVTVETGGFSPGVLNAWIDFNQDGDWKDAGERIISDKRLGDGVHVLTYAIPANAAVGQTYARFRYGYERGIGPGGADIAGEVEDYRVLVLADEPQANDDGFTVDQGSFNNVLDVLANDFESSAGPLTVIAVGTPSQGGSVQIGPGGGSVIYTPAANFFSPPSETFTYTVRDPAGKTDSATVTVTVLPAFTDPVAVDDMFPTQVVRNSVNNALDVLANDLEGTQGPIRIVSVTQPANGAATIDNRGTADPSDDVIRYSPDPGFSNLDQFTYTIANSASPAATSTATVSIQVQPDAPVDDIVDLTFDFTDLSGNVISSVSVGSQFRLRASVQDIRTGFPTAPGVFAAYQDILYDFGLVSVVPSSVNPLGFQIQFGSNYLNVQSGDAQVPGIIDEVGAVQTSSAPLGDGKFTVFTITFTANAPGVAEFLGDPADVSPAHDVLLFEPPVAVPLEQVRYDVGTIAIVGGSVQSALDVNGDGEISPIDALAVINTLNFQGPRPVDSGQGEGEFTASASRMRYDVNGDGMISPIDALAVINYLNAHSAGSGESGSTANPDRGEGESFVAASTPLLPAGSPTVVTLPPESSTTASHQSMADLVFASLAANIATETTNTAVTAETTAETQVVAIEPLVDVALLEVHGSQDPGMPLGPSADDQGDRSLLDELAEDVSGVWDAPESDDIVLRFLTD